ncbi:MAG: hypothetical protein ACRDIL_18445 [Candidatus Limnocylindrales bacterium]
MEIDIAELIARLESGAGAIPGALIAIILLGGPTLAWLLYRLIVEPRRRRLASPDLSAMWVCAHCRSVNELRMARCYRCNAEPVEADIELIDSDPAGPRPLMPVGPGLDLDAAGRVLPSDPLTGRGSSVAAEVASLLDRREMGAPAHAPEPEAPRSRKARCRASVPVGPGRPQASRPRRAVVAGRNQDPDEPPAA